MMSDDFFEFDIDSELDAVQAKVQAKASQIPSAVIDETECESCKV